MMCMEVQLVPPVRYSHAAAAGGPESESRREKEWGGWKREVPKREGATTWEEEEEEGAGRKRKRNAVGKAALPLFQALAKRAGERKEVDGRCPWGGLSRQDFRKTDASTPPAWQPVGCRPHASLPLRLRFGIPSLPPPIGRPPFLLWGRRPHVAEVVARPPPSDAPPVAEPNRSLAVSPSNTPLPRPAVFLREAKKAQSTKGTPEAHHRLPPSHAREGLPPHHRGMHSSLPRGNTRFVG